MIDYTVPLANNISTFTLLNSMITKFIVFNIWRNKYQRIQSWQYY